MKLLRDYRSFLYQRLWDAGKFGSLDEAKFQILPWVGATLIFMFIGSAGFNLAPNSYPQLALVIVIMLPLFMGIFIVFGVQFRVARDRKKIDSIEGDDNG